MAMRAFIALALCISIATTIGENTGDLIVPEEDFSEVSTDAPKAKSEVDVLNNIVALKAYCISAWDDARMIYEQEGRSSSMVEFVNIYGQTGSGVDINGKTSHVENIVTEYANLMAKLETKYNTVKSGGVNAYILKNLDHAVRTNPKGALYEKTGFSAFGGGGTRGRKMGHLVTFSYQALGLENRPRILVRMSSTYTKYLAAKAKAHHMADNANALAATMFLKSKSYGRYKSFLTREIEKVTRHMRINFNFVAKKGFGAAKAAYKKAYNANRKAFFKQVRVQAPASAKAAESAAKSDKWQPPPYDEMVKIAYKREAEFYKKFKSKLADPAKMVKELTEEAGGIKMYVSTTGATNSASTMKPNIKFVGSQNDADGTLRTVPGADSTFVQHFKLGQVVGEVSKIVFTGTGSNQKWNGQKVRIRVGSKDAEITPFKCGNAASFWLESGKTIECVPDTTLMAVSEYNKAQCQGWKQTAGCSHSGTREKDNDKGCTDEIDSTMSGYCQCDQGPRAKLDCGHAEFTCAEICEAA